jgi:hypothetical protein
MIESIRQFRQSCNSVARNTAQRAAEAYRYVQDTQIMKIAKSYVGRSLINCINENTWECAGYYIAAEDFAELGGSLGSKSFQASGAVLGGMAAVKLTQKSCALLDRVPYLQNHTKTRRFAKALAASSIGAGCVAYMQSAGFGILRNVGQFIGFNSTYYAAGILGAYACIKLCGSEEVLWDENRIAGTYPFKTIQSMILVEAADQMGWIPKSFPLNFCVGQVFGSLFYHPIDAVPYIKKLIAGEGLNGLPKLRLNFLNEQQIRNFLGNIIEQAGINPNDLFAQHPAIEQIFRPDSVEHLSQQTTKLLQKTVNLFHFFETNYPNYLKRLDQYYTNQPNAFLRQDQVEGCLNFLLAQQIIRPADFLLLRNFFAQDPSSNVNVEYLTDLLFDKMKQTEEKIIGFPWIKQGDILQSKEKLRFFIKSMVRLLPLALVSNPLETDEQLNRKFYLNAVDFGSKYYSISIPNMILKPIQKFLKHQIRNSDFE